MSSKSFLHLAAALSGLLLTNQAFAWTPSQTCNGKNLRWAGSSVPMRASMIGFPAGPWRDALAESVTRWFNQPSLFSVAMAYEDPSVGLGNGQNEVWWSSNPGAPAITNYWYNTQTCTLTEADVRFNNTVPYDYTHVAASLWPYGGSRRPFQTTAMHELGHVAGLGHEADVYNIMGQDWTHIHGNCGLAYAYPGEDAVSGVVALYGLWNGSKEELGVANWRRTGAVAGGYSAHRRTRLLDSSGVELPLWTGSPEPVYRVNRGQVVRLEMTYESMGRAASTSSPVRVRLSGNSCITGLDPAVSAFTVSQGRGSPFTTTSTVTIPANLASGSLRWLGARIDDPSAATEFYDNDYENASYLGIRVN